MYKIFIINGKGGSGKDTFVKLVKENCRMPVFNYSTIDIIKKMAYEYGWDGKKSDRDRLFLCKLKEIWTWYNNLPYKRIYTLIDLDIENGTMFDSLIWFIHCREHDGINAIKEHYEGMYDFEAYTVFCKRDLADKKFGNSADDNVNDCTYDIEIDNNGTLNDLEKTAKNFIKAYIENTD